MPNKVILNSQPFNTLKLISRYALLKVHPRVLDSFLFL